MAEPASKHALAVAGYCRTFAAYAEKKGEGNRFKFSNCSLGNRFFAGCFLENDQDFNRTLDVL